MAQSGRFGLSLRVLAALALTPDTMQTSAALAKTLNTSPVMVRRVFSSLGKAGFLMQRKGPQGGAKLKASAKNIPIGDVYISAGGGFANTGDKAMDAALKRVQEDVLAAMNESSLAALVKRMRKAEPEKKERN